VYRSLTIIFSTFVCFSACGQVNWISVDSLFQPLPASVHVYKSETPLDGKPNIAYYVEASLNDRQLRFFADTSKGRRLTPAQFFERNDRPLLVVNTTFFSFATNQNLNVIMESGDMLAFNVHSLPGRGKDTFTYRHPFGSAIGISKKRKADVAWLYTDSTGKYPWASQRPVPFLKDSINELPRPVLKDHVFSKWKMKTAVGGGPVLVQGGQVHITNNEEIKFAGKAINDRHPRTAMGYTADGRMIVMVVEGRHPGRAEGASLVHLAEMLQQLGCVEALNLDGGGSSCMLVNGKETIRVSDGSGQRPVPGVFMIGAK
jgi:hypothetical protein